MARNLLSQMGLAAQTACAANPIFAASKLAVLDAAFNLAELEDIGPQGQQRRSDKPVKNYSVKNVTRYVTGHVIDGGADPQLARGTKIAPETEQCCREVAQHVSLPVFLKSLTTVLHRLAHFALILPQFNAVRRKIVDVCNSILGVKCKQWPVTRCEITRNVNPAPSAGHSLFRENSPC